VIRRIVIRRFKRFADVEFVLPDHIVLAGPNNCGKSTVLQAIAAWGLALNHWKQRSDFQRHKGAYSKIPIARQATGQWKCWSRRVLGRAAAPAHVDDLRKYLAETQPPAFLKNPGADHPFLIGTKARTELIPPALAAAGLPDVPYTRYHEIAAVMAPDEIHPEVIEKLDAIVKAFGQ
jgi:AAA domain